jgi:phosphate transport system protein
MPLYLLPKLTAVTVQDDLVQLMHLATNAILAAAKALVEHDEEGARQVTTHDWQMNSLRFAVEERCYYLLEHATDSDELRRLVGMIAVATNLERIGDYAAGIAHQTVLLANESYPVTVPLVLPQMAEVAREMVEGAVEAFLAANDLLAESIVRRDKEIDELHEQVNTELVSMLADPVTNHGALALLWISQHFERIGDRAMNICERVIYITTGDLKEFR